MFRRTFALLVACGFTSLVLVFDLPTELTAAGKSVSKHKKPIRNPKFDASAAQVDLFDAVEAGQVTVKLIPKNAMGGNVLIENKSDKPLTVKIPEAVVGVSIHSQIGLTQFGLQGAGNQVAGNGGNAPQQIGGGVLGPIGNGFPNGQNNGQNGQPNGQGMVPPGFFSIPPEQVVSLQFNSVCLEHGKPEPGSHHKYTLAPVSKVSQDAILYQLLAIIGTGKVDAKAAQAAAWHLTDKMSFQELSEKINTPLGALTQTPEFSREQITAAQELIERAKQAAEANPGKDGPKSSTPPEAPKSVRVATS